MSLSVKIRKDTGTLWITGTVTPTGLTKGYRIRKRAISNDRGVAEMEAEGIERDILSVHRMYPAAMTRGRRIVPDSWGRVPNPPAHAKQPFKQRRGYWSPNSWTAGLDWREAPEVRIYVMEGAAKIKVGLTIDVKKRLSELNAASPVSISPVYDESIRADVADWCEFLAHRSLIDFHCHSEWFTCPSETAISAVKAAIKRAEQISETWVYAGNNPSRWEYQD